MSMTSDDHDPASCRSSTMNTRDLGRRRRGWRPARRRLYRSDVPMGWDKDFAELERRLTTVIDLRQPNGFERPFRLHGREGVDWHNVECGAHNKDEGPPTSTTSWRSTRCADAPAQPCTGGGVLAHSEGAALFHCTAGKDRTGLLAFSCWRWWACPRIRSSATALTHDIEPLRQRLLDNAERTVRPRQFSTAGRRPVDRACYPALARVTAGPRRT